MEANNHFYEKLKIHTIAFHELLGKEVLFKEVPENWFVVVADIENSTGAVTSGLHNEVNLAATGSIIAVLNELKTFKQGLQIPYFFGGDGATFIVPSTKLKMVSDVLSGYRNHVEKNFSLNLKIGSCSVKEIYQNGHSIRIAKTRITPSLTVPVVLGTGLKYAEQVIKKEFNAHATKSIGFATPDLTGMECRWDEITPPNKEERILCLLVYCPQDQLQAQVYGDLIKKIVAIFGNLKERQPISNDTLKLDATFGKIKREMIARIGKYSIFYLIKNWLLTNLGVLYFNYFEGGKKYLTKISELSDTLMIDGSINTVMAGNEEDVKKLVEYLDEEEATGKLIYGIHVTYASVMSCYVQDRKENHIHFVDATEGGYTKAAASFKAKLKSNNRH